MRVIYGIFKGLKLNEPKNRNIRPTTDKVKEAIFDSIQFDIVGKTFLDLFSGSGQMGIEALSRGAKFVTFVDESLDSIKLLKSNLSKLGSFVDSKYSIVNNDALSFLKLNNINFNFVFMDPPYNKELLPELISKISDFIHLDGTLICEHRSKILLPDVIKDLAVFKYKSYGTVAVTFYKKLVKT